MTRVGDRGHHGAATDDQWNVVPPGLPAPEGRRERRDRGLASRTAEPQRELANRRRRAVPSVKEHDRNVLGQTPERRTPPEKRRALALFEVASLTRISVKPVSRLESSH